MTDWVFEKQDSVSAARRNKTHRVFVFRGGGYSQHPDARAFIFCNGLEDTAVLFFPDGERPEFMVFPSVDGAKAAWVLQFGNCSDVMSREDRVHYAMG